MDVQEISLPNFLLIGAPKSGTTALYAYLSQHPQIYLSPEKEPHFFGFENESLDFKGPGVTMNASTVTSLEDYKELFSGVNDEIAIGEASALYLYLPTAPIGIRKYIPDAKLIAILRNPIDRAYASFTHLLRDNREPLLDFSEALKAEPERIRDNWGFLWRYTDIGFYGAQLERYYQLFPLNNLKVVLYDDFRESPLGTIQEIFGFLNVDSDFCPDMSIRHNVSGVPKNRILHQFINENNPVKSLLKPLLPRAIREKTISNIKNKNLIKPSLSSLIREELSEVFRADIDKLQDLLQRDLSHWLQHKLPQAKSNL